MAVTDVGRAEPRWRERGTDQLLTRAAERSAVGTALVVGALIAMSWAVSYWLGGSRSVGPQLFHLGIVVAAARFRALGALVAALVSGVVCGPLLPLHVDNGTDQSNANWIGRLMVFLVVGQAVAALQARSLPHARQRLDDHRCRSRLHAAVGRGEFTPAYQPIIDLRTGRVVGAEALARWRHPDGRVALPAEFIPDAERTGAITAIDEAIMAEAFRQLAEWHGDGTVAGDFGLSVNVSAGDLSEAGLVARVASTLAATGVDPACMTVEITETALVEDPATAIVRLTELKALGVSIALDDFGVGQSSLSSVSQFPIDCFKIDRSFVVGLDGRGAGTSLVRGVVQLAASLELASPTVEGIETADQLRDLLSVGCERGQGYLFGRPMFSDEAAQALGRTVVGPADGLDRGTAIQG